MGDVQQHLPQQETWRKVCQYGLPVRLTMTSIRHFVQLIIVELIKTASQEEQAVVITKLVSKLMKRNGCLSS
jgi:hypothetical protein